SASLAVSYLAGDPSGLVSFTPTAAFGTADGTSQIVLTSTTVRDAFGNVVSGAQFNGAFTTGTFGSTLNVGATDATGSFAVTLTAGTLPTSVSTNATVSFVA